uniref:Uncharacterized protein n=1 Tax=Panagrolaimus superbus TaxID=310955 RepID=A0A914YSC5_9BILA
MNCCCFKILFAAFLLLNSANFQENFSNNVQFLDGKIHKELADEMLSDDVGIQQGNDVKIIREGPINLTLTFNKLEFEVCKDDCIGESNICYESLNGLDDTNAVGSCTGFSSSCEFKVKNDEKHNTIVIGEVTHVRTNLFSGCLTSSMKYPLVEVLKNLEFESCDPKVNPADKMIKLQVIHLSSCPIIVKNAEIHVPEVASTKPPPTQNPNDTSLTASFPWWGILIIVFAFVFAGIGIAFVVYCIFKKRQTSKHVSPPDANIKPTVSNTNVATFESPSGRKHDFTKFELLQKSKKTQRKKAKKQTTQEPTTTEIAPAPVVNVPNAPILPPPAQIPSNVTSNNYYPPISRSIPRSLKQKFND